MRVLQIHNEYRNRGGEDVVVSREAELLRDAGHHVTQHLARNPEGSVEATRSLVMAPWNPVSKTSASAVIEEAKPDVAHVHNTWFDLSPSVIGALARHEVPVVMSLHNYRLLCVNGLLLRDGLPCRLCVGNSPMPGVRYRCYRDSLPASAAAAVTLSLNRSVKTWDSVAMFLASSSFVAETYVQGGLDPKRIVVKPNFAPDPGPRRIPVEDSDVVLYVGRLSSEKGIAFLAHLWSRLDTGLTLRVIGDGDARLRLEEQYPGIEFMGHQEPSSIARQMVEARALLFPSTAFEACPLVILEAFAAGVPVMANRRGAMTELVGLVDNEWLRAPEDVGDWTQGLSLVEDDRRVARAGRRARAAYESAFTPDMELNRLESAYETAIN